MSATFKGTLKKDKRRNDLKYPVYLRITYNRDNRYYHLGFSVHSSDWSQRTGRVKSSHFSSKVFNNRIERAEHQGQKAFFELEDQLGRPKITAKMILGKMRGGNENDFFAYAQKQIDRLEANEQFSQFKQHRTLFNKLKHFYGDNPLPFDRVTVSFLNDFEDFLATKYNNAVNTIHGNLKIFRRIIRQAVKEDLIAFEKNPFLKKKLKRKKTQKVKLTHDEIKAIHQIEAERGTRLFDAKNTFLFSFYCAGIRFSDLTTLTWDNIYNEMLAYSMSKTGTTKEIPLVPNAIKILNKYGYDEKVEKSEEFIFPLLDNNKDYSDVFYLKKQISSKNVIINKNLKKVAKKAEIKKNISFHIARHSFADYARKQKVDLYTISKALGHSDLKTTEHYLKNFDQNDLKNDLNNLFDATN